MKRIYIHCYKKYVVKQKHNVTENIVTVKDVLNDINQVESNKCDGYGLVYTDHFIQASHKLHVFLSLLFTAMLLCITGIPGWF